MTELKFTKDGLALAFRFEMARNGWYRVLHFRRTRGWTDWGYGRGAKRMEADINRLRSEYAALGYEEL